MFLRIQVYFKRTSRSSFGRAYEPVLSPIVHVFRVDTLCMIMICSLQLQKRFAITEACRCVCLLSHWPLLYFSAHCPLFAAPHVIIAPLGCRPRAPQAIITCMHVCHRGHYEGLSRCRLVGSCVLPGEDFFT